MRLRTKLAIIFSIGVPLLAIGLALGICWSMLYTWLVNGQLTLTPTSTNYNLWKETPIPMFLKIYMFNLTNPESLTEPDKGKPNFVEMGPYVFREVDYKVQQVWDTDGTITYQRKRVWHFDQSLSNGSLSDSVTNVNPITATVAYTFKNQGHFFKDVISRIMKSLKESLSITRTVNQLLFEGFDDPLLKIARKLNFTNIPMDKFGWFFGRNGSESYDGTFTMYTGETGLYNLGELTEWNYSSNTTYPGNCGIVRGTNGDLWPPLPDNKTVTFFVSDICTTMTVAYDDKISHKGLTGVRYISDKRTLDNGTLEPSRLCYNLGEPIPSGALDISKCKWGAPAYISLPHFYLADSSYRENIDGMNPSKEKHELQLSLEPKTGVPLTIRAQLQLNLMINHDDNFTMFKNVKGRTFIPMLWFTQEASLTDDYASTVKFIIVLQSLGSITSYGIAGIGLLLISIGAFLWIREGLKGEDDEILLSRGDNIDTSTIND